MLINNYHLKIREYKKNKAHKLLKNIKKLKLDVKYIN